MPPCIQFPSDFRGRNTDTPQAKRPKRAFASTCLVPAIKEHIYRDWLRGVPMRSLCVVYELRMEPLEDVLREQARAQREWRVAA